MNSRSVLFVGFVLALSGCNSSTVNSPSSPPAPKKPSYVRFINFTSDSMDIMIDGAKVGQNVAPEQLTQGTIASVKQHKVTTSLSSDELGTFKSESGTFTTVAIRKVDGKLTMEAIKGGTSIAPESGASIELLNFTDAPVSFKSSAGTKQIQPKGTETIPVSTGQTSVELSGGGSTTITADDKEIWAAYAVKRGGKLTIDSVRVKGIAKPSLGGTSKMGGG